MAQNDPTNLIDRISEQVFKRPDDETKRLQFDEISRLPALIRSVILFDSVTLDYRDVLRDIDVPLLVCAVADQEITYETVAAVMARGVAPDARFDPERLTRGPNHLRLVAAGDCCGTFGIEEDLLCDRTEDDLASGRTLATPQDDEVHIEVLRGVNDVLGHLPAFLENVVLDTGVFEGFLRSSDRSDPLSGSESLQLLGHIPRS